MVRHGQLRRWLSRRVDVADRLVLSSHWGRFMGRFVDRCGRLQMGGVKSRDPARLQGLLLAVGVAPLFLGTV